jgi:hypothetical protein
VRLPPRHRSRFEADLAVSERMRPGRWDDRPLRHRVKERAVTLVRREL